MRFSTGFGGKPLYSYAPAELLSENKNYVAMTRMTTELELVTDRKEKLLELVETPQNKTSTLDHSNFKS